MAEMINSATPWPEEAMEHYRWLDAYLLKRTQTASLSALRFF